MKADGDQTLQHVGPVCSQYGPDDLGDFGLVASGEYVGREQRHGVRMWQHALREATMNEYALVLHVAGFDYSNIRL